MLVSAVATGRAGPRDMNYVEALRFLAGLQWFGARFGLETARRFARHFGHPEDGLRFVHLAGTNGKGSTCAMIESVYRRSGLRVGLHTSPHLVRFGERIQIGRQMIPEAETARLATDLRGAIEELGITPSFFEAVTIMALRYFAEQKCDLVVWETGLGGRLDATNIVSPLVSVITNVQFDHEKWLGGSLAEIALEKAGIIKPFRPVVTGADPGDALDTVLRVATEMGSPAVVVPQAGLEAAFLQNLDLPLAGAHQRRNAALALAVIRTIRAVVPASDEAIRDGLANVLWPGRFQIVQGAGGVKIVVDGAHNPAGIAALRAALEECFPGQLFAFVLGVMRDKNWLEMCRLLAPLAASIRAVPIGGQRGAPAEWIENACREANPGAPATSHASLAEALRRANGPETVVVTGSLHLVGEALDLLEPLKAAAFPERELNEWLSPAQLAEVQRG
jgi:dihydrofolate synthase/folylpolyglutamate synthase